ASGQILDGERIPDPDEGHRGPRCSKGNRNGAGTGVAEKRDEEDKQHEYVTAGDILPGAMFFSITHFSTSFLQSITFKQSFHKAERFCQRRSPRPARWLAAPDHRASLDQRDHAHGSGPIITN
ncbi:Orotate phosphoribosyltransferase, partial [Clarias magur]